MDPFTLAKLIELGIGAIVRITQVWINEDGSFEIVSYCKGTHTMAQANITAMGEYLKANKPATP